MVDKQGVSGRPAWRQAVAPFEHSDTIRSCAQLANTLIPFFGLFYLMYRCLEISYGLTLALAVPTALFWVRMFVLFHDCTHRSLFPSAAANTVVGSFLGFLTLTPYFQWRSGHGLHHGSIGNLDRRSSADVWTMTVQEYLDAPLFTRLAYRVFRNPFFLLVLAPIFKMTVWDRIPNRHSGKRERWSVHATNLALLGVLAVVYLTVGFKPFFQVTLPPMLLGYSLGIWMFYVQHNFEDTYWERQSDWDYATAALHGSSFYRLPPVLQWFTANIGYHHLHHLSPRIPNYRLQECHEKNPLFQEVPELTLGESLKCLSYRLWDEDCKHLVGWDYVKIYQARQAADALRSA